MNPVISPLRPGMQGSDVGDLQTALLFLFDRALILPDDPDRRKELSRGVQNDQRKQVYGDFTAETVKQFQVEHRLQPEESGLVDEVTAKAINDILRKAGALDDERPAAERSYVVSGQVRRADGLAFAGALVRAIHHFGRDEYRLGDNVADAEGRYTIRYEPLPDTESINLSVSATTGDGRTLASSDVVSNAAPVLTIDLEVPIVELPPTQRRIEGRIVFADGRPADALGVQLHRRQFGGTSTQLNATASGDGGLYSIAYGDNGRSANLELRVVGADGKTLLAKPLQDLGDAPRTAVNLIIPSSRQTPAPEYTRLTDDLAPLVGELAKLRTAEEKAQRGDARNGDQAAPRRDLTVLHRATGWDARLIALVANAEQVAADPEVGLNSKALYALFRAGLPRDKDRLAQVNEKVVDQALDKVRQAGIVDLNDDDVAAVKSNFKTFSLKTRLAVTIPGAQSTYQQLLDQHQWSDEKTREDFASLVLDRPPRSDLWQLARDQKVLDEGQIQRLQLQGKLAFLAGNSAQVTAHLQETRKIGDPADLAGQDFYKPGAWETEVRAAAGVDAATPIEQLSEADQKKLADAIPPAFAGETLADRLNAYTEDMARKVRRSYPTQTVARMIETDDAGHPSLAGDPDPYDLGAAKQPTAMFLKGAAAAGFKLGVTQVDSFVKEHPDTIAIIDQAQHVGAIEGAKTVHRVYQITPSNETIPILMKLGLKSAHDVVALSWEDFWTAYGDKFASEDEARLIYRKAQQVSAVTYNLFSIAQKLDSEAQVYAISAPPAARESLKTDLIKQYPTLESLFGSLDYCECEHCQSVLSPAAYLVDILQFVDPEQVVWQNFLDHWQKDRGEDYLTRYKKAYDALIERRPDIPHIPLTCENTLTALPYIDVVNEILEYFVAHKALSKEVAYDTGDATTEELLAEPQHITADAYAALEKALYPLGLPFDLWLETVRRFCEYFETPLDELLETLRPGDALFAAGQTFDRAAVFVESLGLSPREYAIFTDPDPLADRRWFELYGYSPRRPVIANPTNVENATLTIANADAAALTEGTTCTYLDVSANALSPKLLEIREIGLPDAPVAGQTVITFVGTWDTPPVAGDLLVVAAPEILASAKTLSRRLGVTYKELTEIVQTGFVNPDLVKLALLYKLGVSIQDVVFYDANKSYYDAHAVVAGKAREELDAAGQKLWDEVTADKKWPVMSEVPELEDRLDAATNEHADSGIDVKDWLTKQLAAKAFDGILLLADPDTGCNFDQTTLRYAGGNPADGIAFLKINHFVRLWRKLGWTIEETDRALQVFVPENAPFTTDNLDQSPLRTALFHLAHLKKLDAAVRVGKQSRLKLLSLWAPIVTTGKKPLYAQLFLTPSVLKSDAVFDDPLGNYLSPVGIAAKAAARIFEASLENVAPDNAIDPAAFADDRIEVEYDPRLLVQYLRFRGVLSDADKDALKALSPSTALPPLLDDVQAQGRDFSLIKGHLPALQGALRLTAGEIAGILTDAGLDVATAPLSLENVSLLYRYGLLAKGLSLAVDDLIALKQLSGLDPVRALLKVPVTQLDQDHPFVHTLAFVELVERAKESGFTVEDLVYLLRHQFEETGKYRPDPTATLTLIRTLDGGIGSIRAENAVPADPGTIDEVTLRQKIGLVLPPDVAARFLAMLNGTADFPAIKTGVADADALNPADFAGEPAIRAVGFAAGTQRLTVRGVLFDNAIAALKQRHPAALFAELLTKAQDDQRRFFATQLQPLLDDYLALFSPHAAGLTSPEVLAKLLWLVKPTLDGTPDDALLQEILSHDLEDVLPTDVGQTFLDMLSHSIEYTASRAPVEAADKLDPAQLDLSGMGDLTIDILYNEDQKRQTLHLGVLVDAQSAALKAQNPTAPLFAALIDDVQRQIDQFYDQHLAAFFSKSEFNLLLAPLPAGATDAEKQAHEKAQRQILGRAFAWYLVAVDPTILSGERWMDLLGTVMPAGDAETFRQMLTGEIVYEAQAIAVEPEDSLDPAAFAGTPIAVDYDAAGKVQALKWTGVPLSPQITAILARHNSPLLASLLGQVAQEARSFYETHLQAAVAGGDFNLLFTTLPASSLNQTLAQDLLRQKQVRLATTFLTLLQQRLIRQFVVQTMTEQLGEDPALVESLLTDARLLGLDQPLLNALVAVTSRGLDVAFRDNGGADIKNEIAADADTGLKGADGNPLRPAAARSARFDGYLEVPQPGAYRFSIAFDKKDAAAELRFAHLTDPVLTGVAPADVSEIGGAPGRTVDLKPGQRYRFTLDATQLNGGNVRLLVQSETLPKDTLAQLTLFPQSTVDRAARTLIVLAKVVQVNQTLSLTERELRYLVGHPDDFGIIELGKLPADGADDTLPGARTLFAQFERLARYARLKRDLAGGTEALIDVFAAAPAAAYPLIADLARREPETVSAVAAALNLNPANRSDLSLERLWEALQVVERLGVPVASLLRWTRIVGPGATPGQRFAIARDLREAIKARFDAEDWQRVARPIYDKLRQRQRDALVAHVMHQRGFARLEQLYEYFLIDAGMEPVVQTSRIRLAIGSVQLFIQRCLLNLEPHVHPSAINAKQWEWMKRYRVWEANRKIFLFPENWLEPEFRDDKTYLFTELEGNLLQGDVSSDLVEDAFLTYLRKLEQLARLNIVAMHLEDNADPTLRILHVFGRTYGDPVSYFYRRYAHQTWTPWEPVTAEIEGDHLAPVIWRDRLYLFWVTFLEQIERPQATDDGPFAYHAMVAAKSSQSYQYASDSIVFQPEEEENVADLTMSQVRNKALRTQETRTVEAHLHWSSYLNGAWSTRESAGVNTPTPIRVTGLTSFARDQVFVHVAAESGPNAGSGVFVYLGGPINRAFYLAGRNSLPESQPYADKPKNPFQAKGERANGYTGNGSLAVAFTSLTTTEDGKQPVKTPATPKVLAKAGDYRLLPCDNDIVVGGAEGADETSLKELAALVKPVFFQDRLHTLFVEPTVEERTVEEWQEWVTTTPKPDGDIVVDPDIWDKYKVLPQFPDRPFSKLIDPVWDPADFGINPAVDGDVIINSFTLLQYGEGLIGPHGVTDIDVVTTSDAVDVIAAGGQALAVHPGSGLTAGNVAVARNGAAVATAGLTMAAGGLNVVSTAGVSAGAADHVATLAIAGFGN